MSTNTDDRKFFVLIRQGKDEYTPEVRVADSWDSAVALASVLFAEREDAAEIADLLEDITSVCGAAESSRARYHIIGTNLAKVTVTKPVRPNKQPYSEEWSPDEKATLCSIVKESEPLPYPLIKTKMANGTFEQVYLIPEGLTDALIAQLWPFVEVPKADEVLYDIHAEAMVRMKDCLVIRYNNRNLLVSSNYPKSGGMSVDLSDPRKDQRFMYVKKAKEDKTTLTTIINGGKKNA